MRGTLNQKKAIKLLQENGWTRSRGGKHQVKMTKPGSRPITLPQHKGRDYPNRPGPGDFQAGGYWADVPEQPGCFAAGDSLDEPFKSLQEGIALYLADEGEQSGTLQVATATLTDRPSAAA